MRRRWTFLLAITLLFPRGGAFCFHQNLGNKSPCARATRLKADESANYDDASEEGHSKRRRGRLRPLRRQEQLSSRAQARVDQAQEIAKRQEIAQNDPNLLVDTQFSQVVSPPTLRALQEILGVDRMTVVQAKTFALAREGESLVARARTGTGKSLAFLVPIIERLLNRQTTIFQPGRQIGALVIAPTRELAIQIADTAKDLVTFHPMLSVRAVYGGTSIQRDVLSLQERLPAILVATPGRLDDLIRDESIRGRKFTDILKETSVVVLDEADLLVMGGFGKDILRIFSHLPRKRQTMLFSATIPNRLRTILPDVCMSSEWTQIDCVEQEQQSSRPRVTETYLTLDSIENYVPFLLALARHLFTPENQDGDEKRKIMIFFPAVRMVRFFADVMRQGMKDVPVWEIHSQLSQSARRRVADSFRNAKSGVLLTSDVSARGMDYPAVDTVLQYGMPNRRDLYLHRIGRTGRAGRTGKAMLVLMPFETLDTLGKTKRALEMGDVPSIVVKNCSEAETIVTSIVAHVREMNQPLRSQSESLVLAFLAYYAAHSPPHVDSSTVRKFGESLATSLGFVGLPPLSESLEKNLAV